MHYWHDWKSHCIETKVLCCDQFYELVANLEPLRKIAATLKVASIGALVWAVNTNISSNAITT